MNTEHRERGTSISGKPWESSHWGNAQIVCNVQIQENNELKANIEGNNFSTNLHFER
jgi:hypothetical protein